MKTEKLSQSNKNSHILSVIMRTKAINATCNTFTGHINYYKYKEDIIPGCIAQFK